ncbi:acyl-CoA transferase [Afipia sp. P52-10]|uniref:CaiB/BaiF CoA transferase family protein n=1 Tax=Afipia sp. P52-10 TaxID=1429916 RepID=UPI0003DF18A7|nr:CaiB/BaiF CoA-transferase family protein [Afipia sp. P52-10]ETR78787.1 acyl-CoA transferase [Afipia sp. P52-10]
MSLAYEGVRILDFTQLLSGPVATQQFALLGAEVIKVERPGVGDQFANTMHTEPSRQSGRSFPFQGANLGKRSLTLDLKRREAVEIILTLAKRCDALVENFAAGVIGRLGLDYESVRKVNPNIVYCSVSGYGQKGPKAGVAAYDGAIQAASGMMAATGDPRTGPVRASYMPVDISTALLTSFALASGLYRKLRTGEGQYIDVAMMDTAVLLQMPQMMNYLNAGVVPQLSGNRAATGSPTADAFATKDGHVMIVTIEERHVEALLAVLGLSELHADPKYRDETARRANEQTLRPLLDRAFAADTTASWCARLSQAGVACAAVSQLPDVAAQEQFNHRSLFAPIAMAGTSDTQIKTVVTGYTMTSDGPRPRPAPALGEHSEAILAEAGYTTADIARFRKEALI